MNGSVLNIFSDRGTLAAKDVTPWQTFSGKGMKFQLQSYDWAGYACVSYLTMRTFLGLMKMETIICTPYSKDLPIFSYDLINAMGKRTLLIEVYDTQLEPIDLSTMQSVKESYRDLKDKSLKPNWYDKAFAQYQQDRTDIQIVIVDHRDDHRIHRPLRNRTYG